MFGEVAPNNGFGVRAGFGVVAPNKGGGGVW